MRQTKKWWWNDVKDKTVIAVSCGCWEHGSHSRWIKWKSISMAAVRPASPDTAFQEEPLNHSALIPAMRCQRLPDADDDNDQHWMLKCWKRPAFAFAVEILCKKTIYRLLVSTAELRIKLLFHLSFILCVHLLAQLVPFKAENRKRHHGLRRTSNSQEQEEGGLSLHDQMSNKMVRREYGINSSTASPRLNWIETAGLTTITLPISTTLFISSSSIQS